MTDSPKSQSPAPIVNEAETMEGVLIHGDLSKLTPAQRLWYMQKLCDSMGLNILGRPFEYIPLRNKLTLYLTRAGADQLAALHGVTLEVIEKTVDDGVFFVRAKASIPSGRSVEDWGGVVITGLRGDDLINAKLKGLTRAYRRATSRICGLGWLTDDEIDTIPGAARVKGNPDNGEIDPVEGMTAAATAVEGPAEQTALGPEIPSTQKQREALFAKWRLTGLTDDQLRVYLLIRFATSSTKALSKQQMMDLLTELGTTTRAKLEAVLANGIDAPDLGPEAAAS